MAKDFRICESIETLQNQGPQSVTTEDLLAIILGNKEKAARLLHQENDLFSGGQKQGLTCIAEADYDGLKYRGGLTTTEAARILASIEIGRRIAYAPQTNCVKITCPGDAAAYLQKYLAHAPYENFYVLLLNCKNRVIRIKKISEGSTTSSLVSIPKVLAAAITAHSTSILVGHNHPSLVQPITASAEDEAVTRGLKEACQAVGLSLLDHIIISGQNYYSFRENGRL